VDNNTTVNNFYFDYGIQYSAPLKNNIHLTVGAVFAANTEINARTDLLSQTFFLGADGIEHPRDTITKVNDVHGKILIPLMTGLGFSFEKTDRWVAGADFKWQNWKAFKAFGLGDSLVNSYQISAGAEFLPDPNNYYNYLKRIRYRIGLSYSNSYLDLRNVNLDEYSASVGLALPLRGNKTALNFGLQIGSRGTTNSSLIQESYFKFIVGFSIYERWFLKRKYY
jgi:long-subunit fatty acid transport protein